jgi:hypothetical protein
MKKLFCEILILIACLCFTYKLNAQDSLFTENRSNSTITATASNYTPQVNEPVKIHYSYKIYRDSCFIDVIKCDGMELIEGEYRQNFIGESGDVKEWDITVKFSKPEVYDVYIGFPGYFYFRISFYVGGAFRESLENRNFVHAIAEYKKYVEKITVDSSDFLRLGLDGLLFNKLKKQQTLEFRTGYDSLNLKNANEWNKKHYFELKKEYNKLMDIHISKYKLPVTSPVYKKMKQRKEEAEKRKKELEERKTPNYYHIEAFNVPEPRWELLDTTLEKIPIDTLHDGWFIMKHLYPDGF